MHTFGNMDLPGSSVWGSVADPETVPAWSRPLGAQALPGGVHFSLYAAPGRTCAVRLFGADGGAKVDHLLTPEADGHYGAFLPGVGLGALYKFVLDGRELPDPYARYLPFGVHGPAAVMDGGYAWRHGEGVSRPLREQVIYELHVGTFTDEGTFTAALARLPELAALGVTTIELMPLAAFDGRWGWGYDGVALFAPHAGYGTPDELRALVDGAHGLGLSVFLDVVYNHLGPSGNYLRAYSDDYFDDHTHNAWGAALNYAHPAMRRLVLSNALYWLTDFRFDGLRLDATHAIVDPSSRHILGELATLVHAFEPARVLIVEDERNEPALVTDLGVDAIWADDFHHAVHVTLTGEVDGYYAGYRPGAATIADTIAGGWLYRGQHYPTTGRPRGRPADELAAESLIYCLQNHDQVGNRAFGERLSGLVGDDAYRAASLLLLFLPMTPLLFMGQEWGARSPYQYFTDHSDELGRLVSQGRREEFKHFAAFSDPGQRARIPDPQSEATFAASRLHWDERTRDRHQRTLNLYRQAIAFRRTDPVMRETTGGDLRVEALGDVLAVRRTGASGERLLLVNFGAAPVPLIALPGLAVPAQVMLSSAEPATPDGQLSPATAIVLGDHRSR
jgi:maltooligosyltrehalose trehalohydrolase